MTGNCHVLVLRRESGSNARDLSGVTHDSEILSVLIFLSCLTKLACLNIFPGLIFLRFGYIRIYCVQIFLDTQVCLSYTYPTNKQVLINNQFYISLIIAVSSQSGNLTHFKQSAHILWGRLALFTR